MDESNYFNNEEISENDRRNIALQVVNSLREAINLAKREPNPITYEKTLDILAEVSPNLYTPLTQLLKRKNESETVRFYKQLAETSNSQSAEELIDEEINKLDHIAKENPDKNLIKRKVIELKGAKEYFSTRKISEHKVLSRDTYLTDRSGYFGEKIYENDEYVDYELSNKRILRLRLLHPDKSEAILGCDLIYEQFDLLRERVRFVHLQYKMWENNTMYFSDERMMKQLERLEQNLCKGNYCNGNLSGAQFRLPFCAAFLRPTNKIQSEDSKLLTTGIHIPLCKILEIKDSDNKLTKDNCQESSISSKIFEELFNSNMIGSRWISIDELDKFYNEKGIKSLTNSIRVHAQEVSKVTQEEIDLRNIPF